MSLFRDWEWDYISYKDRRFSNVDIDVTSKDREPPVVLRYHIGKATGERETRVHAFSNKKIEADWIVSPDIDSNSHVVHYNWTCSKIS